MIALLVVSHSRALAEAAVELAEQMVPEEQRPPIRIAAGLDDGSLGTDATAVSAALEDLSEADGVLVLVDLGSALLSAQMALEFVDPDLAAKVTISSAPLVEGLVTAVVTAAGGAALGEVDAEARQSLKAKQEQLSDAGQDSDSGRPAAGAPDPQVDSTMGMDADTDLSAGAGIVPGSDNADSQSRPSSATRPVRIDGAGADKDLGTASGGGGHHDGGSAEGRSAEAPTERLAWDYTMTNPNGLHARPAATLVSALARVDARVMISNASTGAGPVDARSVSSLAALQLRAGQVMHLTASGAERDLARRRLDELAASQFGDAGAVPSSSSSPSSGAAASPDGRLAGADSPSTPLAQESRPAAQAEGRVIRGPARIVRADPDTHGYAAGTPAIEQARFDQARHHVAGYLEDHQGGPFAAIFSAQEALLNDPAVLTPIAAAITRGTSAVSAIGTTMNAMGATFDKLSDPYLRERGQDVRSIARMVLSAITGASLRWAQELATGIWVMPELDALTAATADLERCLAVITLRGGDSGHGAIIAARRGIPLLAGYPAASEFTEGELIEVDPAHRRARRIG